MDSIVIQFAGVLVALGVIGGALRWTWKWTKRSAELAGAVSPLEQVAKHFRDNGGSTLPELIASLVADMKVALTAIDELKGYAIANREAAANVAADLKTATLAAMQSANELQGAVLAVKELARDDREKLDALRLSGARIEAGAATAATAAEEVKTKLGEAQQRADAVHADEEPGSAADAASQS